MNDPQGTPPATPVTPGGDPASEPVLELDVGADTQPATSSWGSVRRTPLRGGTIAATAALTVLAAGMSWWEGGATDDQHLYRQLGQSVLLAGAALVLAISSRRIVLCTVEGDRPVPWGRDERDQATSWVQDAGTFAAVLVMSLLPALVLSVAGHAVGAPTWVQMIVAAAGLLFAAAHFPFAIASSVLRNGAMGALWGVSRRAFKANPFAARTAVGPALAFFVLFAGSFVVAGLLVPGYEDAKDRYDHTVARDLARGLVFVLRFAALWAALCTCRVAGLLARDVPEIREVLE